jgi:hypothetical protein
VNYQVFISHSSKNADIASAMKSYLDARGTKCWKAPEDIPYGTDWDVGIVNGLEQCQVMVLIFSKEADDSHHVKKELAFADQQKKIIIPFKIDDYMPDKLKYFLALPQWLDGIVDMEAAFGDLYSRLQVTLTDSPEPPPPASQAPLPTSNAQAPLPTSYAQAPPPTPNPPWPSPQPPVPAFGTSDTEAFLAIIPDYQDWATNADIRSRLRWDKEKLKAVAEQLERERRIIYRDGSGGAIAIRTEELSNLESNLANGLDQYPFFVNVGENFTQPVGTTRHWDDLRKYGFISAGGGARFAKQMQNIPVGAEVYTYISEFGYVGQARVIEKAVPIEQYTINGTQICDLPMVAPNALHSLGNHEMCEWLVRVEWIKAYERSNAIKKTGLYVHVATSCRIKDPISIKYLREQFGKA